MRRLPRRRRPWERRSAGMFGSLTSGALGRKFEMLSEGYPMAPWEISQLDRHMLSYCVSLENTPTQVCAGGRCRTAPSLPGACCSARQPWRTAPVWTCTSGDQR